MIINLGPEHNKINFEFKIVDVNHLGLTVPGMLGKFNKFGIYMSGGLDSTILLCLILEELKSLNKLESFPLTCFTVCKTSGSTYYAQRLMGILEQYYSKSFIHINNIENPNLHIIPTPLKGDLMSSISKQNLNTLFFTGLNDYPKESEKVFVHKEFSQYDDYSMKTEGRVINPFSKLLKYHILDLYYKLNLEFLIPYTHSCTKNAHGVCNNCTGCEERSWAFEVLGKTDPEPIMPNITDLSNNGDWKYSAGKTY